MVKPWRGIDDIWVAVHPDFATVTASASLECQNGLCALAAAVSACGKKAAVSVPPVVAQPDPVEQEFRAYAESDEFGKPLFEGESDFVLVGRKALALDG